MQQMQQFTFLARVPRLLRSSSFSFLFPPFFFRIYACNIRFNTRCVSNSPLPLVFINFIFPRISPFSLITSSFVQSHGSLHLSFSLSLSLSFSLSLVAASVFPLLIACHSLNASVCVGELRRG